ncbi:MAG: hypothetical protein K6F04_04235 [bacterium]|nr:hypothetical protein [bacterium]
MYKRVKKFKDVLGASIMEVIFVLGIMAVLTPVVIQFAFKDLADVRYLNLAKQIKQVIKNLTAYASSERDNWPVGSGNIAVTGGGLANYGLDDSIDEEIKKHLTLKYIKNADDSMVLYGVIDMTSFPLDAIAFNKTLFYVEDNIGYVVNGEKCEGCTTNSCVCAINGKWGENYSTIGGSVAPSGSKIAVVRVDDGLLEDEYDSSIYLYRNRDDSELNVMGRDFNMGTASVQHDVKNVKQAEVLSTVSSFDSSRSFKIGMFKANSGIIGGLLNVTSLIFNENTGASSLEFGNEGKVFVPKIIFGELLRLASFSATSAYLLGTVGAYKPIITVANLTDLSGRLDLQELEFNNLTGGSGLYVYGLEDSFSDSDTVGANVQTKLRVEVPNVKLTNLRAKVINVNNNYASSNSGNIKLANGKITTTLNVNLYGIPGNPSIRNIWSIMDKFDAGTTGSDSGSIAKKLYRYQNKIEQSD